jgi:asparagine synthase (glutamine-hydrolysing)
MICKKAREYVKVCLSGEGGDEVFVGYDRFIASKIDCYYRILPKWLRSGIISKLVSSLPDQSQKKGFINMLKRFISGSELTLDGAHMRWQYFMESDGVYDLFKEIEEFDPFYYIRRVVENCGSNDRLEREIYIDMRFTMPDSVLMKVDKMSMAHSLEVRVPFLDHKVVEFSASIPSNMKLKGLTTKAIFKDTMKDILPPGIAYRKKQGYSFPMKNWLRKELKDYMIDILSSSEVIEENFNMFYINRLIKEHLNYTHNHSHLLWALISLAVWYRIFFNR